MFEETMLDRQRTAKRWSVPVSITLQLACIGLALLLPLIHGQRLPVLSNIRAVVYLPAKPAQAEPHVPRQQVAPRPLFRQTTITAPSYIPPHPVVLHDDAPSLPGGALIATGPSSGSVPGLGIDDLVPRNAAPPPEPPRPAPVKTRQPPKPVRVSAGVQAAKRVSFVMPVYPELARRARISGTVELIGVIAGDGTIQSLRAISGPPLLVHAALDAVRQWRYQPTLLNGQPVEVIAPITVNFALQ